MPRTRPSCAWESPPRRPAITTTLLPTFAFSLRAMPSPMSRPRSSPASIQAPSTSLSRSIPARWSSLEPSPSIPAPTELLAVLASTRREILGSTRPVIWSASMREASARPSLR